MNVSVLLTVHFFLSFSGNTVAQKIGITFDRV